MVQHLSRSERAFILESLRWTKIRFQEYERYPSYEFKQGRIADVEDVVRTVRALPTVTAHRKSSDG